MAGVNKVILVGNLGRDPEVRHLESGRAVANFSIATSETYKNKEGEKLTKPIDNFNHAIDAVRYFAVEVLKNTTQGVDIR